MKIQKRLQKEYQDRIFSKEHLAHVAFPMGGLGAGMICLEGTGALSHVSLRHKPDIFNEPLMFAALYIAGSKTARVLEGPVPMRKIFGVPGGGRGRGLSSYGLPRFSECSFLARFPFGKVILKDKKTPLEIRLTGWSPFIPGNPDDSSLPVAAVEYGLHNNSSKTVKGVFSFHAANFMKAETQAGACIRRMESGFILAQPAKDFNEGYFAAFIHGHTAKVDCAWFRTKKHRDPFTMVWRNISAGLALDKKPHAAGEPSSGASLSVPFKLKPGAEITIPLLMAWHVPRSDLTAGQPENKPGDCKYEQKNYYIPWYAKRFKGIAEACEYWRKQYVSLRNATATFSQCFHDTTLPSEAVEAAAANLTILKSPTCLRQADGRLWGWEGCNDKSGSCSGTCTHVWNYAQAIPHLFPSLERGLRETEHLFSQDKYGHQNFRSPLPTGPAVQGGHAAADGQLGGIIKTYREWRISGDTAWMKSLWPRIRASLNYCIKTWDPDHTGTLIEPHHNTYDIEFWGADAMCTGFYLGALQAAVSMGKTCGADVGLYEALLAKGRKVMESRLWNGNYFIQRIQWRNLHAPSPDKEPFSHADYSSPEAMALLAKEGPKYQYGNGCLSDGVLGDWLARVCGLAPVLDEQKAAAHLDAVFRHNFRATLVDHANPCRPGYALGDEAGLLLCSWPKKRDEFSLPFYFSTEVWTGIEYQVAAHLIMFGRVQRGLDIIRAVRQRYDGKKRNPFNEYECGHWYARAMSSYSLLQAFSGARYDAVEKTLYLNPAIRGDFRAFLCTAGGYGTVGVKKGKPFLKVIAGKIEVQHIITAEHCRQ